MKIIIVGGYGVFGGLTARLLERDGHTLWLAGRNPKKAQSLAKEIGAKTLKFDRRGAPDALFKVAPDVIIDAAGPFQHYAQDPYLIARRCIDHGCHYLDLSDSSDFTSGISQLDKEAKAARVFVLSGASSVPGLSSIIVADLINGIDDIDLIDIAILPGNRAPRGMSVIKSIVSGVGRTSQVFRDGTWQTIRGWTDKEIYELAPGMRRAGYFVDVPDIHLLPERTGAKTVMFRAGLELGVMNAWLALLAKLRKRWRLELPEAAYSTLFWLSKALYPFGTDRGGMQVSVTGQAQGERVARKWTLIAEKGDGPFVPGLLCRTLLRESGRIARGARPCLAELPRSVVEDAMADLALQTVRVDVVERALSHTDNSVSSAKHRSSEVFDQLIHATGPPQQAP